jgi:hypothetical protein
MSELEQLAVLAREALEALDPGSQHNAVADWVRRLERRVLASDAEIAPPLNAIVVVDTDPGHEVADVETPYWSIRQVPARDIVDGTSPVALGHLLFNTDVAIILPGSVSHAPDTVREQATALLSEHMVTLTVSSDGADTAAQGSSFRRGQRAVVKGIPYRVVVQNDHGQQPGLEWAMGYLMELGPADRRAVGLASAVLRAAPVVMALRETAAEQRATASTAAAIRQIENHHVETQQRSTDAKELNDVRKRIEEVERRRQGLSEVLEKTRQTLGVFKNAEQSWEPRLGMNPVLELTSRASTQWEPRFERLLIRTLGDSVNQSTPDGAEPATGPIEVQEGTSDRAWAWMMRVAGEPSLTLVPGGQGVANEIIEAWRDVSDQVSRLGRDVVERFSKELMSLEDSSLPAARIEWWDVQSAGRQRLEGLRTRHVASAAAAVRPVEVPRATFTGAVAWGWRLVKPHMMYVMMIGTLMGGAALAAWMKGGNRRVIMIAVGLLLAVLLAGLFPTRVRAETRRIVATSSAEMAKAVVGSLQTAAKDLYKAHVEHLLDVVTAAGKAAQEQFDRELGGLNARRQRLEEEARRREMVSPRPSPPGRSAPDTTAEERVRLFERAARAERARLLERFSLETHAWD